jgi:hypothetical protein
MEILAIRKFGSVYSSGIGSEAPRFDLDWGGQLTRKRFERPRMRVAKRRQRRNFGQGRNSNPRHPVSGLHISNDIIAQDGKDQKSEVISNYRARLRNSNKYANCVLFWEGSKVTKYESDTIDRCDCDINRNFHNKP